MQAPIPPRAAGAGDQQQQVHYERGIPMATYSRCPNCKRELSRDPFSGYCAGIQFNQGDKFMRITTITYVFLLTIAIFTWTPANAYAALPGNSVDYCTSNGWSSWKSFHLTTQWLGNPLYNSIEMVEFRPQRRGNHQIEFSGPWTKSVKVSGYWYNGAGQSGQLGYWELGDVKLDLWTGSADVFYRFSVWYEPVTPGGTAIVEYRVSCASESSAPGQQGFSSVARIFDFNSDGTLSENDYLYGFQPRYAECKGRVTSNRCAEIDYDYDNQVGIRDADAFFTRYRAR